MRAKEAEAEGRRGGGATVAPGRLAGEHQVETGGGAHERDEALRASRAGQQAQHHLRQAEHGLGRGRRHTVAAGHRHLEATAEARA